MIGTQFACLSAVAIFCLILGIRWWGARSTTRNLPLWQGIPVDFIVSLLLATSVFFGMLALDSATIQWTGISGTEKFLLALVALTLTLLSGIAIKVARDATQDIKDTTKNIEKLHGEIQQKQEAWDLTQMRLTGTTTATAQFAHAAQLKEYRSVAVWEHILDFYQAADLEAITFSANNLRHSLHLLANYPEACQALTDTDRDFIAKLVKHLGTGYPEVTEAARELLRQSQ